MVAASCGLLAGNSVSVAVSPARLYVRRRDGGHAGLGAQLGRQAVELRTAAVALDLGHDEERAVEAGAEPLREQVVGLARGRRRGVAAGVAAAQPHAGDRQRDQRAATTVAATANARGRRSISALKRAQRGDSCSPSATAGTLTRRPNAPSSAGRSVSEPTIVSSTASAAAIAGPLRNEMPSSTMPSRATTTVEPANSTERPAVSMAVRVAARSVGARGALAAEAADDQQGVVDADAERDHHRQGRREVGDVEDGRGGEHERHRQRDRGEGHDQRHRHRGERAEHEQEHDDRDRDADELAGALRRLLGDLDGLAAELDLQTPGRPGLGGVDHALDVGLVELVGLAVEEHGRERDVAVARYGARPGVWALHRRHVRQALRRAARRASTCA